MKKKLKIFSAAILLFLPSFALAKDKDELSKTTSEKKPPAVPRQTERAPGVSTIADGPIKNAATSILSTSAADTTENDGKNDPGISLAATSLTDSVMSCKPGRS